MFYSEITVSIDMPLYLPGYTVPPRIGCGGYGCDDISYNNRRHKGLELSMLENSADGLLSMTPEQQRSLCCSRNSVNEVLQEKYDHFMIPGACAVFG